MFKDKEEESFQSASSTYRDIPIKSGDRLVLKTDKEKLIEIKNKSKLEDHTTIFA